MAENYVLIDDIIKNHTERMLNLRKFYPFFCLMEAPFPQELQNSSSGLDMSYFVLASLRFFINENNFNDTEVTKARYSSFCRNLIRRDFELKLEKAEEDKLINYIFDKLTNQGRAFEYTFFDPADRTRKTARVRLIETTVRQDEVVYTITEEGIEFYLASKEFSDESRLSTDQLLLEKLIKTENFKGGIEVINRINLEVVRLHKKKEEAMLLLTTDVNRGVQAVDSFMESTSRWFEEERKSFARNRELVDKALQRLTQGSDISTVRDITRLETMLKTAIDNHSRLIKASAELSRFSDEIIHRKRIQALKNSFDFTAFLNRLEDNDCPEGMAQIVLPMLEPRRHKTFSLDMLEAIADKNVADDAASEKREKEETDLNFRYEDEILSERTGRNFAFLFRELLSRLEKWNSFKLLEFNAFLELRFGKDIYKNRDYYSFLVHLSGQSEYSMEKLMTEPHSFLEQLAARYLPADELEKYRRMCFKLSFGEDSLTLNETEEMDTEDSISVTDITFERTDTDGR